MTPEQQRMMGFASEVWGKEDAADEAVARMALRSRVMRAASCVQDDAEMHGAVVHREACVLCCVGMLVWGMRDACRECRM